MGFGIDRNCLGSRCGNSSHRAAPLLLFGEEDQLAGKKTVVGRPANHSFVLST